MATLAAADDDAKAEAEHPVLKMQIQGICPYGWHIANLQDWKDLIWAAAQASKGSRYEIAESSASYKAIDSVRRFMEYLFLRIAHIAAGARFRVQHVHSGMAPLRYRI